MTPMCPGHRILSSSCVLLVLAMLGWVDVARAQTVAMSLSRTTIPFTMADPDTTPVLVAPLLTVTYRVRGNGSNNWQITVSAPDLSSGSATIPVANISWTATPAPPFQAGTMNASIAQRLAGGTGSINPAQTGQVTFQLQNLWAYNVGTYTAVFTFTLTAP